MKIILLKDIDNLGKKDEVIDVPDGYAKNYLIKNKYAIFYSKNTADTLTQRNNLKQEELEKIILQMHLLKKQIESEKYTFSLKTNNGKAFGHISVKHLMDEIQKKYPQVNKYMIKDKTEWGLGTHLVKIYLFDNIVADVNIEVFGV